MNVVSDIMGAVDALAVLFLVGSLLFLWMLVRFIVDDIDLGASRRESADETPVTPITTAPGVAGAARDPGDDPAGRPRKAA